MDAFGKVAVILLAAFLLFLWPVYFMAQNQDRIVQTYLLSKTTMFLERVKNTGSVTKQSYERYLEELAGSGNIYDIQMVNARNIYYPVYEGEEFLEDYQIHQENVYQDDILEELYEGDGEYKMNQGDYFSIQVKNLNQTFSNRIHSFLGGRNNLSPSIYVSLGGAIRDEVN